jgi:hypothetical protein
MASMLRRRFRRKRTVANLARMLTALEDSSRTGRALPARRPRVSLGRAF